MCPYVGGEWGRQGSYRERERDNDNQTTYVVSHVNALVLCVLYDSPRRKALCSVRFADDELWHRGVA